MSNEMEKANEDLLRRRAEIKGTRTNGGPKKLGGNILKTLNFETVKIMRPENFLEEARLYNEARAEEKENQKKIAFFRRADVPARHADKIKVFLSVESPGLTVHDTIMKQFGTGFNFVIGGKRGVGKTQIGSALIYSACKLLIPSLYAKVIDFFIDLRETYKTDGKTTENGVLQYYCTPKFLVLDSLEERAGTDFEDRLLTHMIDMRYRANLDTIFITNQTRDSFTLAVGSSVGSRILETGDFVECEWESYRRK